MRLLACLAAAFIVNMLPPLSPKFRSTIVWRVVLLRDTACRLAFCLFSTFSRYVHTRFFHLTAGCPATPNASTTSATRAATKTATPNFSAIAKAGSPPPPPHHRHRHRGCRAVAAATAVALLGCCCQLAAVEVLETVYRTPLLLASYSVCCLLWAARRNNEHITVFGLLPPVSQLQRPTQV